ncbi:hypothetical protein [Rhizobium sp. Root1220]|uniref:hypothetical protein n=1 Tax=Rhizobium sp. Root1220 TaxID=1736432 RepID=UPI000700C8C4|nr:hypothetical protein [Rhizobium sp. Root1220]KQV80010.1 hypothetical protein ASC90_25750 [Rhizobium sp. Root1220]
MRALPVGGDQDKALKALEAIKVYPLANPKQRLKSVDTTSFDMDRTSLKWEDNIQFGEKLRRVARWRQDL